MALFTRLNDGRRFELTRSETRIGRAPDNHIVVADTSVSRHHAHVLKTASGFLIVDGESQNGVVVEGKRVNNHFLRHGDVIRLGKVQFRFDAEAGFDETVREELEKKPRFERTATMSVPPPAAMKLAPPKPAPPKNAPPGSASPRETPAPAPATAGSPATAVCLVCGSAIPADSAFCTQCGRRDPFAPAAPVSEPLSAPPRSKSPLAAPAAVPPYIDGPAPGQTQPPAAPRRPASSLLRILILAAAGIVAAFLGFRFLRGPQSKLAFKLEADRSVAKIAPELEPLGPMARVRVKPEVAEIPKEGAKVSLKDGARLVVPEGAFAGGARLETSVISMGLEHFDYSIRDSWAYVIKTVGDDKAGLKKTITLEIPYRPEAVRVAQLNGDTWQRIDVPPGPTTKVTIGHFSSKIFEVAKSNVAEEETSGAAVPTIQPSDPLPPTPGLAGAQEQKRLEQERIDRIKKLMRERLEGGNAATRSFFGVGEQAGHSSEQNCSDLSAVLDEFKKDPKNFEVPSSFQDASCSDLGIGWLFPGQIPSLETGNYYWREVAPSMDRIKQSVLASERPLTEAQILRIAIVANDGNVLKGILAAHNFLKDVTYKGRVYPNPDHPNPDHPNVPDDLGAIASHLESWRHGSNVSPAGEYDKMGPIYHLFAAATARAWCGAAWGSIAINGEAASRAFGTMGDKVDSEKGNADTCGRDFGATVASLLPTTVKGISAPAAPLWKFSPNPITGEKAPCPPSDVKSWSRRLCPWSPKSASAEPCSPGFCWDGGFQGSLACKPEAEIPNGHRNDLSNIICNAGFHLVFEECTGIPKSCDPNQ